MVLDISLIAVMLVSGLLAMVRGFMREVLSITAWILAAGATFYAYSKLLPAATSYFNSGIVAKAVVIGGVFLVTLLAVSIVTVRISDAVLDSRVGALDRTLGFIFGLARGFVIVAIAYFIADWLLPKPPQWIAEARSRYALKWAVDELRDLSPDLDALYQKYKGNKDEPGSTPSQQHGAVRTPADPAGA